MDARVRRLLRSLAVLAFVASQAVAQQAPSDIPTAERVGNANGAILRGLDKRVGDVTDVELAVGDVARIGRMQIFLNECRYPVSNPSGNAYAFLVIREEGTEDPVFVGWMVAGAPALNALEHPRYDIWVMRCTT